MHVERPARHVEIDLLRTLALGCMVLYHVVFDLTVFHGWNMHPLWRIFARATACAFLLISGASATLSLQRKRASKIHHWKGIGKRCATIGGAAVLITIGTYVFDPERYIRFGILHLIAISCLILPLTMGLREGSGLLGVVIMRIGLLLGDRTAETSLLLPFGIPPPMFATFDYFPIFPWLGMILIGQGIGYFLYIRKSLRMPMLDTTFWRKMSWPGRHSLAIYLAHQPVILLLLRLLLGPDIPV